MPGLYIHIPFCRRKCYYCDFFSTGSRGAPWGSYAAALVNEARLRSEEWQRCSIGSDTPATIYIGGGTPSLMPPKHLYNMVNGVREALGLEHFAEFTVELNPEDVTDSLAEHLWQCGVNRVSMGVQSFADNELQAIGRRHSSECALRAYDILRKRFENVSIDLIFGLPLQSLHSWQQSVCRAIELHPAHLSAYSLMWEEKTALMKMQSLGKVSECDEDLTHQMFELLTTSLCMHGYRRYEISNYCRPGYESVHNSAYWSGAPYIGLGPGAHSYDGARMRRANPADIKAYISHFMNTEPGISTFYEQESLSDEELHEEYIMTRLRRSHGIELAEYTSRFGTEACEALRAKALLRPELLHTDEKHIYLHHEGILLSDTAIVSLL